MINDLQTLIYPKTIVVVGVSREKNKVGRIIFDNLKKSPKVKLIPVNVKAKEIDGYQCFTDLLSINEFVDLVILAVPALFVNDYLRQCLQKNIKNVVVLTAGFAESGKQGIELEKEFINIIKDQDINVLGPNTLGFINNNIGLNATFASFWPKKGGISLICQSGAFTTVFMDWAEEKDIGIAKIITIGNKVDINEIDVIDYLANDEQTKAIAIYLESFSDGNSFINTAKKLIQKKPLIILKAGKTTVGQERAASHTGKMAGSYDAALAAFEKSRVLVADSTNDFFNLIYLFSKDFIIKNEDLIILTNAGGPGIIATDEVVLAGWKLVSISPHGIQEFRKKLPSCTSTNNPVDIIGDASPERFQTALEILDKEVCPNILILVSPQAMTDIPNTAKVIAEFSQKTKKNLITCFMGGKRIKEVQNILNTSRCLNFSFPKQAVATIDKAYHFFTDWANYKNYDDKIIQSPGKDNLNLILKKAVEEEKEFISQDEVKLFAEEYNIPLPPQAVVINWTDAKNFTERFGFPLVLKTQNIHKVDRKEVYLNLNSITELQEAFNELKKIANKLLLQKQIKGNIELILGSYQDKDFGSIISFGLGGIYTEVLKKFKTIIPSSNPQEIDYLLKKMDIYRLISPIFRGQLRPYDKLVNLIVNFSRLIKDYPLIKSAEINPVFMTQKNIYCVDFRILLK